MTVKQTIIIHGVEGSSTWTSHTWEHVWESEEQAAEYEVEYRAERMFPIMLLEDAGGALEFQTEPSDNPADPDRHHWPEVVLVDDHSGHEATLGR